MENNKDIGKAVKEKLGQLRKSPSNIVWESIRADLEEKKKRRILPFWFVFACLPTAFIACFIASDLSGCGMILPNGLWNGGNNSVTKIESANVNPGQSGESQTSSPMNISVKKSKNSGNDTGTNEENIVGQVGYVSTEKNGISSIENEGKTENQHRKKYKKGSANRSAREIANRSASKRKQHNKKLLNSNQTDTENRFGGENQTDLAGKNAQGQENDKLASSQTIDSAKIADAVAADSIQTTKIAENKKPKRKKEPVDSTATVQTEESGYQTFSIFLYAAPTSFSHFAKKSLIDSRFDSAKTSSEIVFNYGGYLCFNYDKDWAFRFGVAKTVLRNTTEQIRINNEDGTAANTDSFQNIKYDPGITNAGIATAFSDSQFMDVTQELAYVEFPIEAKYHFYQKSISLDAIVGFSALFLKGNSVEANGENGGTIEMGSTKDIYLANFSANIGLGASYSFANNFKFNLEPMFKYHIKTSPIPQQPFSVLVQAGIEYTFNSKKKTVK
jgi:hypothetical protein